VISNKGICWGLTSRLTAYDLSSMGEECERSHRGGGTTRLRPLSR